MFQRITKNFLVVTFTLKIDRILLFGDSIYIMHIILAYCSVQFLNILMFTCHFLTLQSLRVSYWFVLTIMALDIIMSVFFLSWYSFCASTSHPHRVLRVCTSLLYPLWVVKCFFSSNIHFKNCVSSWNLFCAATEVPLANYSFSFLSESFAIVFSEFRFLVFYSSWAIFL